VTDEDPEAEALLRAGEEAREREAARAARSVPAAEPPPPRTPADDERFEVFLAVRHAWLDPSCGRAVIFTLGVGCLIAALSPDIPTPVRIALVALAPVVAFGPLLALRMHFAKFRQWRARLPFRVEGWEALVDDPQLGDESWRPLRVRLVLGGSDHRALAEAALALFAERANRCFYSTDERDTMRKRWTVTGAEAAGSANTSVLAAVHRLCERELLLLARRGALEKVELVIEGDAFSVSRPAPDP